MARNACRPGRWDAERVGRRLGQLTRIGLVARGFNYALVGILAVQVALGDRQEEADRSGALRAVSRHAGGAAVLWLLAAGFAALAVGRLVETAVPRSDGWAIGERGPALLGAVACAATSVATVTFILHGAAHGNDNAQSKGLTARAMSHVGGRFLVGAVGVAVAVAAVVIIVRAVRGGPDDDMDLGGLRTGARRAVLTLGVVGEIARGVVFGAVGFFLVTAAATFDPGKAEGLDGTLRKLATAPHGSWILLGVASGLVTFGLFSCCQARWYRPRVPGTGS
ncbi:DUF1206 domain-containing protein [Actinomadura gamaensis]|uniref:DUF1206 domain-containing protein n=1 Tax=Actinomadura gamaensis TaxID=1763541 RepID=A0ABV9TZC9_9ACTN